MEKEIKIEDIFNDEKREAVKKAILKHTIDNWVTWEYYLFILGVRLSDYTYTPKQVFDNIEYFKDCWRDHLSQYKALEFFSFELDNKQRDEKTT